MNKLLKIEINVIFFLTLFLKLKRNVKNLYIPVIRENDKIAGFETTQETLPHLQNTG